MSADSTYTPPLGGPVREHPRVVTAVLSVVGYVLVVGAILGYVPSQLVPRLSLSGVNLVTDLIAVVNVAATLSLIAGWWLIRNDRVDDHRRAMGTAFGLILVFLVLYLWKLIGGGTKEFVGPELAYTVYLALLAVHVLLSMVSVPVVLYALVLGLTHTPRELREETAHRRVGRVAAGAWILSLTLGVVTYLMLNHLYDWEFVRTAGALALVAAPATGLRRHADGDD
jgi:putative membrane protein